MFSNLWLVRLMLVIKYVLIHFHHWLPEGRIQVLDELVVD
jgi:hypothetical protein